MDIVLSAEQWNAIDIGTYNEPLLNAEIRFPGVYGIDITVDAAGIPTLTWEEDWAGAESYEIWRMADNGEYELIATVDSTYFTDATATPGTMYFYAVRAVYEDSYSDFGDVVVYFKVKRGPLGKIPD